MAGGDTEDIPMQPIDGNPPRKESDKVFVAFSKKLFIIAVIVVLVLMIIVGVLAGVISSNYAEERVRRELLQDKNKRDDTKVSTTAASPTTEPTGPEPWYKVRLPRNVVPNHYDVYLHPNLTTETFQGDVNVLIEVVEPTQYILIHINEMNVTKSGVYKANEQGDGYVTGEEIEVKERMEYKKNNYFVFILPSKIASGKYIVQMSYKAFLTTTLNGLYLSTYIDSVLGKRKLATTKFEPTDARKALPCFDEPAMKATFTTTIVHEKDYTALSNMPEDKNDTLSNGLIKTRFQKSVPMSTYLLAFIVCDFKYKQNMTGIHGNITVRVWTTRDQIDQTDYALYVASKIITYFERYYKVDYPLPKQDLITIPDFSSGAMENWGLITFREARLLYQDGVSSESNKQSIAAVVSHELAHQWFGNIVSPKWWNDLWLNEGFASYVEYLGVAHVHPDWEMMEQFLLNDLQLVFPLDSLVTSHPISVEVDHPKKIKQIFDRISYSKGSSIIRMLAGFLGDKFTEGLQYYLKKYAFKNAETPDLWNALGSVSNTEVKTIMDTWTLQMGYPVVTVKRSGNKATLTQQHFLLDRNANMTEKQSPYNYRWYIPFTYIAPSSSVRQIWMNKTLKVEIPWPAGKKWIKGNYKQVGYYRVHYDQDVWEALSKQLQDNSSAFTTQDRSGLIDDAFSLARAGYLKYSTALNMLKYLKKEENYVPWKTALNSLSYLKTVLGNRPSYGLLKKFIRDKVKPLADKLGWKTDPKDGHIDKYLRVSMLTAACDNGDPEAIANASDIFKEWKSDTSVSIDVDLRLLVYRYGVANSGDDVWNWMFERFLKTMDSSEKSNLMAALGYSKQTWILNTFLGRSLNPNFIRTQDIVSVIRYVSYNRAGKYLAWNFVRANWDVILKEFGTSTFRMTSLVNGITSSFNTQFDLKQMERFFTDSTAGTSESARKQSIERTRTNIEWLKTNEADISKWLKDNVGK